MFILWIKTMLSFPAVFITGVNPYATTKSGSFDEATSAYGKEKKRGNTNPKKK